MKLHLGCGFNKKRGYVNCDISKDVNPDLVLNLEKRLPFKSNSIDEIIAEHVFEHVENFVSLMSEIYRVSKPNAKIYIKVPYFSHESAFSNVTHVRFFTYTTFDLFDKEHSQHWQGLGNFKIIKKQLKWRPNIFWFLNYSEFLIKVYQNFFCWIFPARELIIQLEVKK